MRISIHLLQVTSGGPGPCRSYPSLTWTSSLEVPIWKGFFGNPTGWQIGEISRSVGKGHIRTEWHEPKESKMETFSKTNKSPTKYRPRKQTIMSSSHSHLPMFFDGSKFWAVHQSQVTAWICWYNQDTRTIYYLKVWVMTQERYCIFCACAANLYITRGAKVPKQMVSLLWSFWLRGRPPTKLGDWMGQAGGVLDTLSRSKVLNLLTPCGWKSWKIWGCFRSPWMISTPRRIFPETSSFCPSQGQPSHPPAKSPR